jgi:hypothetical protein
MLCQWCDVDAAGVVAVGANIVLQEYPSSAAAGRGVFRFLSSLPSQLSPAGLSALVSLQLDAFPEAPVQWAVLQVRFAVNMNCSCGIRWFCFNCWLSALVSVQLDAFPEAPVQWSVLQVRLRLL